MRSVYSGEERPLLQLGGLVAGVLKPLDIFFAQPTSLVVMEFVVVAAAIRPRELTAHRRRRLTITATPRRCPARRPSPSPLLLIGCVR